MVGRSGFYALAVTGISMAIALTLAVFVDRALKGTRLFQSVFVWPYAIAAPAAGVAFRFIFSPEAGLVGSINDIWPGIWNPAINGWHALTMVIVCHAWLGIGYNFIFFLAALQMIPRSISEAGAMDGARPFQRMIDLQLPLITPTVFFLLIMNLISSFTDSFGLIDVMTDGGPVGSTEVMVYKLYVDGFKGLDYSGAAAQSIVLMLLVIALTFVQFRWVEKRVHYN
jgi:sn-glycerol 3-phosphate transport system permease protein